MRYLCGQIAMKGRVSWNKIRRFGGLVGQTMSAEVLTKPALLQRSHCHNELDVVKCAITFAFHCNLNVCQRCKLFHCKFKPYLSFTGASSSEESLAKKIHSVIFIICARKKKKENSSKCVKTSISIVHQATRHANMYRTKKRKEVLIAQFLKRSSKFPLEEIYDFVQISLHAP